MYRAASPSSLKWEYVGGTALYSEIPGQEQGPNSTVYGALATAGPSIALPLAGDYMVEIGCRSYATANGQSGWMSYDIGGTAAVDADSINYFGGDSFNAAAGGTVAPIQARARRKNGLAAVTLTAKYKCGTANVIWWSSRWLRVTPVRVG